MQNTNLSFINSGKKLLDMNLTEIPYLVKPLFPKTGLISLAGSSDTGKSSFLRQFATTIVLGETHFLGFKLNAEHKRVVYVSTEDDENAIAVLLKKQNPNGIKSSEYESLGYIFDTNNLINKLKSVLEKHKVDCIIIDTFTDLFGGDINSTNSVRKFLQDYKALSDKYKCLIIFLHHTSKASENKQPSKNNLLGSQGFEAKMRLVIEIRKDKSEKNVRHLCIVKGNYLKDEDKDKSYKLKFDENMRFSNLNQRTTFNELQNSDSSTKVDEKENAIKIAKELSSNGLSVRMIAKKFKEMNIPASKSTINNWINTFTDKDSAGLEKTKVSENDDLVVK